MKYYEVIVQPRAEKDIEAVYRRLAKRSPSAAEVWMEGVLAALDSLEEMPARCPLAPEAAFFKREVRHLLYRQYRLLFVIEERHVRVITVRHASRKPLRRPPEA